MKKIIFYLIFPLALIFLCGNSCDLTYNEALNVIRAEHPDSRIIGLQDLTEREETRRGFVKAEDELCVLYKKRSDDYMKTEYWLGCVTKFAGGHSLNERHILDQPILAFAILDSDENYIPIQNWHDLPGWEFIVDTFGDSAVLVQSYDVAYPVYKIKMYNSLTDKCHFLEVSLNETRLDSGVGCAGCSNERYEYSLKSFEWLFEDFNSVCSVL